MEGKKILDVTCGSKTIWFDKNNPAAVFCDKRSEDIRGIWKSENGKSERKCVISQMFSAISHAYRSRITPFRW